MGVLQDGLRTSAYFSLLLTAVWSSVELAGGISRAINQSDTAIYGQDRAVTTQLKIVGEYQVSGTQVLQSVEHISETGVSIMVGSTTFSPGLDITQTDVSMIDVTRKYAVTYVRNTDGSINQVVFRPR